MILADSYSLGVSFIALIGLVVFLWIVWIAVRSQPWIRPDARSAGPSQRLQSPDCCCGRI